MGQKTNPVGFRVGVIRGWSSRWFAQRNFADLLIEDVTIRRYIARRLENAGIARIEIVRAPKRITVDIHTSRPGIVIGRKGAEVDKLREELQLLSKKEITLNIIEVKRPELRAQLVAESVARQLEGRISFRRAMKKSLMATMKMGALGMRIQCGGRLGGAEIARSEKYMEGRVPLHTLRADIDFARATANTTFGTIGVKVWIFKGEVLGPTDHTEKDEDAPLFGRERDRKGGPKVKRTGARSRRKRPDERAVESASADAPAEA
ncbi:MAG: 30S ribosomal protein S3 [candidate division Zixibacteria bacterium]|nr:30S ribosomal protein S3 [candidate division Zixibacteria bacterium]